MIVGISYASEMTSVARAVIEGMAYQSREVINAIIPDAGTGLKELHVDSGAAQNNLVIQFQADLLDEK